MFQTTDIIKPQIDTNEYKFIQLKNKLDVLIIYDKDTDKSAASMSVNCGFYDDPKDTQGLAHFLEHMLFMGTKTHPQENLFHQIVNETGGSTNAHTMEESTTYYYQVVNSNFIESLEIWSHFFIDPLLSPSAVNREINAVDSEYTKNIAFDIVRLTSILKEFTINNHPYYNFGSGNKKTLRKNDIREKLLNLYNKYYSANLMKLVILSNIKINEIEPIIIKLFGSVPNNNVKRQEINMFPFHETSNKNAMCANLIKIVPIKDIDTLNMFWQLPNTHTYYGYKPVNYISYLIGHEGKGSIYNELKGKEYITKLSAHIVEDDTSFCLYRVSAKLTNKGLHYVGVVIDCIQKYIDLIKKKVNRDIYNELVTKTNLDFNYSLPGSKIDYVSELSMNMLKYKPRDIIYGPFKMREFNKKASNIIIEYLSHLNKGNLIITISSKSFKREAILKDRWYGAKYININEPTMSESSFGYKQVDWKLHLPIKNKYIPKQMKMHDSDEYAIPTKINIDGNILWCKRDNTFKIPKIYCSVVLYLDQLHSSINSYLTLDLYLRLVDNKLNAELYYSNVFSAGYTYSIFQNYVLLIFYGFNDNILHIMNTYFKALFEPKFTEKEFNLAKYEYKQYLENVKFNAPFTIIGEYAKENIYLVNYTTTELLNTMKNITYDTIALHESWLSDTCSVTSFIYGNIDNNIIKSVNDKLNLFHCDKRNKASKFDNIIQLNPGETQLHIKKNPNKAENNNAILLIFEIEHIIKNKTPKWRELLNCIYLVHLHINEKFFTQLRTHEQLGYIVRSLVGNFDNTTGSLFYLSFLVQSPHTSPIQIRKRIKKFIKDMFIELGKLNNEKFENYKTIIKNRYKRVLLTQDDEFDSINSEILTQEFAFNYKDELYDAIDNITLDTLLEFYNKYLLNSNTRKVRIIEMYKYDKSNKNDKKIDN